MKIWPASPTSIGRVPLLPICLGSDLVESFAMLTFVPRMCMFVFVKLDKKYKVRLLVDIRLVGSSAPFQRSSVTRDCS
jgi:hypothetical protein